MQILALLVKFLWEALLTHAASDEGSAQLRGILDEAEKEGIDIPFYEPSDTQAGFSVENISPESNDSDDMEIRHSRRFNQYGEEIGQ